MAPASVEQSSQLCVRPTGERWRFGQQASFALADRIERTTISCEPRDRDRYSRTVAVCFKGSEDQEPLDGRKQLRDHVHSLLSRLEDESDARNKDWPEKPV